MEANELRINNLIADSGGYKWQIENWESENKVASKRPILGKSLFNDMPMYGHPMTEYVESLQPILLTEQIMDLLPDFKKYKRTWVNNVLEIGFDTYKNVGFSVFNGDWIYYKIQYLHQLQNLYFALTGEELNVTNLLP